MDGFDECALVPVVWYRVTSQCALVPVFGIGERPHVPSFRLLVQGNIRQNHPFRNHPFANPLNTTLLLNKVSVKRGFRKCLRYLCRYSYCFLGRTKVFPLNFSGFLPSDVPKFHLKSRQNSQRASGEMPTLTNTFDDVYETTYSDKVRA